MIPTNQQSTSSSTAVTIASPKRSSSMDFTAENVKRMFPCISNEEDHIELCCQYLNNTSDLFNDEFNMSDPNSPLGTSPQSSNGNLSGNGNKRLSIKRRKNCKTIQKVDGNFVKTDIESEESIHIYQNENGEPITPTSAKQIPQPNPEQQFDALQSSLSLHLHTLQDEVDKFNGSLVSSGSINKDLIREHQGYEAILSHLHSIFRDLTKMKRFLMLKPNGFRRRASLGEGSLPLTSTPTSPGSGLYNSNVDRLLSSRYQLLQLLHLECTLLCYLRALEQSLNMEADVILSMDEFIPLQLKLEEVCRAYYAVLIKLSYEPTFLKITNLVHRITPTNSACLLLILFRSLIARGGSEDSPLKSPQDDDSFIFEQEDKLTVTVGSENRQPDIQLVGEKTIHTAIKISECKPSIANNRTIVLVLTFLQNLAKNEIFASPSASFLDNLSIAEQLQSVIDSGGRKRASDNSSCSLIAVCCEVLAYFCAITPVSNYPTKSTVRQHTIETISHICLSKDGLYDAVKMGSVLYRKLLGLLSQSIAVHTRLICSKSFRASLHSSSLNDSHNISSGSAIKPNNCSSQKLYLSILRDIYGLLTIIICLTEFKAGREYLIFHNVSTSLYEVFMVPFIGTLNGTESADPAHLLADDSTGVHIDDTAEAYKRLRTLFATDQKVQRYLDRIVGMSSIIVQRLLEPMVIPIEHAQNPYAFDIPLHSSSEEQLNDAANDSSSPNESSDKKFDNFDNSELDEDAHEDDEYDSDEDEDSALLSESSNEHIRQQDSFEQSPLKGRDASFPLPMIEQDETKLMQSYLRFFPEMKHFNWTSLDASMENILNCECDVDVERLIAQSELKPSQSFTDAALVTPFEFNWSQEYERLSHATASVMPQQFLALPELNFLNTLNERNELPQPMTYPFLEREVRRKNLHHVKMLDHVRDRLLVNRAAKRPTFKVVYDIESTPSATTEPGYLQFESKFECGNLRRVLVKQPPTSKEEEEYLLLLNSDVNSTIHTQWFYFSTSGMKPGKRYRFKIINLQKKSILYNSGQQPLFYSKREYGLSRQMWQRVSSSKFNSNNVVAYYRNHYVRSNSIVGLFADRPFYTLEFTFTYPYSDDVCYFAYNIPFSYTFLNTNLAYWSGLVQHHNQHHTPSEQIFFETQTLCTTLKGNDLPVMTITSSNVQREHKPHYMLLTARVHPSESNSSWILKGFVDFLLHRAKDPAAEEQRRTLLESYVFKIIPMLNPDGVINGCTRTDLQRDDLNRFWHDPHPLLHPTIYHSRMLLKCMHHYSSGRNPVAFVDLHGHSRRKNIFSYSCSPLLSWKKADRALYRKQTACNHFCICPPKQNSTCQLQNQMKLLKEKLGQNNGNTNRHENDFYLMPSFVTLPVLLHLQRAPCFNLENCSFLVQKDREHTARVVGWREFDIALSYTIECTASGCNDGPYAGLHLAIGHMEEMGQFLACSLGYLDFLYCSSRHVPIIKMPKSVVASRGAHIQSQTTSPIHHPGNDDFLRNLLIKCTKRSSRLSGADMNGMQIRKLIQLYPDLNMLSGSMATSSSSDSSLYSSATSLLSNSQSSTPIKKKKAPIISIL